MILFFKYGIFISFYRTRVCSKTFEGFQMGASILHRNGNLAMKTMCLITASIVGLGMAWKKRKLKIKRKNFNVITFSQTWLIIFLLYLNNVVLDFLLPSLAKEELLFTLEMLRVIFFENILFKFFIPILMILQSKTTLPFLWTDKDCNRRQNFFMTKQNILPRTNHIKQGDRYEEQIDKTQQNILPVPVPVITVVIVA